MAVNIVITDAGRAEIINAENTGTTPVEMTEIGFGTGQYTATPTQTALIAEFKRLPVAGGQVVADDVIHISGRDSGSDAYTVYEIGVYSASGTLFAVYSQIGIPIINKAAASIAMLAVDITLQALNASSISFGATDFMNPPASETVQGVVELATAAEIAAGTDNERAITPAGFTANKATDVEAKLGSNNTKWMTPQRVKEFAKQYGISEIALVADANAAVNSGFYSMPAYLGATNSPLPGESGSLIVTLGGADTNYITQQWNHSNDTDQQRTFMRHKKGAGAWSAWVEFYHTGNLPAVGAATETAAGIAELATTAEVQAGTDTSRIVTPAGLAARTATESGTGIVELATIAEVQAGTDTTRVVTPAGLAALTATEARKGIVELATTAEAAAGTDTSRVVTPAGVLAAMKAYGTGGDVPSLSSQNLNNSRASGVYYMVSPTNGPSGAGNGWLEHNQLSSTYATQIYTNLTNQKYFRTNNNGTWSSWVGIGGDLSGITTIWTGSATSVDLDTLPGGYPGSGIYLIDAFGTVGILSLISPVFLRKDLFCYASTEATSAAILVIEQTSQNVINVRSVAYGGTTGARSIQGIYKVV